MKNEELFLMKNEELRMKNYRASRMQSQTCLSYAETQPIISKANFLLSVLFLCWLPLFGFAQQYTGVSGLIHVPSAEMNRAGDARIGAHFINRHATPDARFFSYEGKKYDTFSYYLSLTPFSWIELGYTCTLVKVMASPNYDGHGYEEKDRYFSLKLNPLREGKWWPAIAVGCNDISDSFSLFNLDDKAVEATFGNYYVAATKHFVWNGEEIGAHVSYRHFVKHINRKWNGVVGGVTYRPSFARNFRTIAEYTGHEINIGVDCLLWKHLLLQASLQNGKYFSGGVCFQLNLL